ncbi:DUF1684 domain-containing protein [Naasia lichenicola]|uniref:DUF1684 domain-containing protein n=1 Tax=Naasia lichenicola TaxID=2565933 RepID=A0A4S4FIY0_9MICO|nr:DUF1684 domain-containing protein [Naasia lichenicola]
MATVGWRRSVFAIYDEVRSLPPAQAHVVWRKRRDELFRSSPATPLLPEDRSGFRGLEVPDYDPSWRFTVPISPAEPESLDVETGTDGVVRFERIGLAELPDLGSLDVWRLTSYGGGIFIPVKDALSRVPGGTYGGGRYLIDTIKGADLGTRQVDGGDAEIVLDFNFAYNPSCAYDPEWACPLAPRGNTLSAEIPVGERSFH